MIKPADYRPSRQVRAVVQMINESRRTDLIGWGTPYPEQRFNDGTRHGFNLVFRALVQLETEINDPDLIDDVCADLITEDLINRC